MRQCDECDGAGEVCGVCGALPDNCNCEQPAGAGTFVECAECNGNGEVEEEEEEA